MILHQALSKNAEGNLEIDMKARRWMPAGEVHHLGVRVRVWCWRRGGRRESSQGRNPADVYRRQRI